MRLLFVPILIIAVSIPLIFGMIPPNRWYGFRTPRTMSSPEIWYPANRVSGLAMTAAGGVWLAAALLIPFRGAAMPIGLVALAASIWVSFVYLGRL